MLKQRTEKTYKIVEVEAPYLRKIQAVSFELDVPQKIVATAAISLVLDDEELKRRLIEKLRYSNGRGVT